MEARYKLPLITNSEDIKNMQQFCDKMEMNLRSLEAIGVGAESCGYLVIPIIKDKLSNKLNTQLSCKFDATTNIWNLQGIMQELRLKIGATERVTENRTDKVEHHVKIKSSLLRQTRLFARIAKKIIFLVDLTLQ